MKNRKTWITLALFFILIFSLSYTACAAWKTENGNRYYYKNGVALKGGPKAIDGKKYLFTTTGELIINAVTHYNNKVYVSKADGTLLTDWGTFGGKTYYGRVNGHCRKGLQKYEGNLYYFDTTDACMIKSALVTVDGDTYYFQKNGKAAKKKWVELSSGKYYFDANGKALHGLQSVNGKLYLFGKTTGKMLTGSVKYGKYYYYLDKSTGVTKTDTFVTISKKKYYYDACGRRQTGWVVKNGKKYYMDPEQKGAMTTGTKRIDGVTYNFGTKGYVTYNASGRIVVRVNLSRCVVTIYDNGVPVKAMRCSPGAAGNDTPTGVYTIQDHLAWWMLNGPSYGQYCSHFLPNYLFHSVPMYGTTRNPYNVSANDFNKLGSRASGGCIRLCVADAKWIYYNVPIGSTVVIGNNEATPLGKPAGVKMPAGTHGADPTDDFTNPRGYDVTIK